MGSGDNSGQKLCETSGKKVQRGKRVLGEFLALLDVLGYLQNGPLISPIPVDTPLCNVMLQLLPSRGGVYFSTP